MPPLATLDFLQLGSPRHGGTFGFGFSISALKSNEGGYDLVRYIQWQESRVVDRSDFISKRLPPSKDLIPNLHICLVHRRFREMFR